MPCFPSAGRVSCTACYDTPVRFDVTTRKDNGWRITANPLAWGNPRPRVLVVGFSKGPTQAGALSRAPHEQIAFRGARGNAYRILQRLGLVPASGDPDRAMLNLLGDANGAFGFGSLIRCTVTRWDDNAGTWAGTGGNMLGRFIVTPFGARVTSRCVETFLGTLPSETKLVVLYGLGTRLGYVDAAARVIQSMRRVPRWRRYDEVSYGDDTVTFVHTEHFRAQGVLLPNWLGARDTAGQPRDSQRDRLANLAAGAAQRALAGAAGISPLVPNNHGVA